MADVTVPSRTLTTSGGVDVKWFQCDSHEPNKPAIKAIMRAGVVAPDAQQAAFGALMLLACYIAAYGEQEPGIGIRADGQPLNLQDMADECHFRDVDSLRRFLGACAERGHIDIDAWSEKGIVMLPEMGSRADTYTKRVASKNSSKSSNTSKLPVLSCTVPDPDLSSDLERSSGSDRTDTCDGGLPLEGPDQVDALVKLWNLEAVKPLPRVTKVSASRRQVFARALKQHPNLDDWRELIRYLNGSHWWLHGGKDHPNWQGDLDYLCKDSGTKFTRAWEKYQARKAGAGAKGGVDGVSGRVVPITAKYGNLKNRS